MRRSPQARGVLDLLAEIPGRGPIRPGVEPALGWSRDGERLLAGGPGALVLCDRDGVKITDVPGDPPAVFSWEGEPVASSPPHPKLLAASPSGVLAIDRYDIAAARWVGDRFVATGDCWRFEMSADGAQLARTEVNPLFWGVGVLPDGRVWGHAGGGIWPLVVLRSRHDGSFPEDGARQGRNNPRGLQGGLAWSPDPPGPDRLLMGSRSAAILLALDPRREVGLLATGGSGEPLRAEFSPDGRRLAVFTEGGNLFVCSVGL